MFSDYILQSESPVFPQMFSLPVLELEVSSSWSLYAMNRYFLSDLQTLTTQRTFSGAQGLWYLVVHKVPQTETVYLQNVNDNNVKYIQQYIQCQEYTT